MKNCVANSKFEETGFNYTMPLIRANTRSFFYSRIDEIVPVLLL